MNWLDAFLTAYNTVQANGAPLPQQTILNFGSGFTVANDATNRRTTVSVTGAASVTGTGLWWSTAGTLLAAAITLTGDVTQGAISVSNVPLEVTGLLNNSLPVLAAGALSWTGSAWAFQADVVTWANDLAGSSNAAQYVAAISGPSGAGGTVPIGDGTHAVTFLQVTNLTTSAAAWTIQAATGLTGGHAGSSLNLLSGAGSGASAPGNVLIDVGSATGTPSINIATSVTATGTSINVGHNGTYSQTNILGGFNLSNTATPNAIQLLTSGALTLVTSQSGGFTATGGGLGFVSIGTITISGISSGQPALNIGTNNTSDGLGAITIVAGRSNSGGNPGFSASVTGGFGATSGAPGAGGQSSIVGGQGGVTTGNAAAGGAANLTGGLGGTAAAGSFTGGAGGAVAITGGAGGTATGASANSNGGNVAVDGGAAGTGGGGAAGLQGTVTIGANSSATTIGQAGKTTTINGAVTFGTSLSLAGDVTGTLAASKVTTITGSSNAVSSPGAITWTVAGALALVATAAAVSVDGGTTASFGATNATSVVVGNTANAAGVTVNVKASSVLSIVCGANTVLSVGGAAAGDQLTLGNISGNAQGVYKANSVTVGESAASIVYSQTTHTTDATVHTWTIQAQSAYGSAVTNTSGAFVILQGGAATSNGVTGTRGGVRLQLGADTAENMLEVKEVAVGQRVTALCGLATVNGTNVPTGDSVCWIGNAQTNPSSNGATGVTVWSQSAQLWCTKGFGVQAAGATSFDVNGTTAATITCSVPIAGATGGLPLAVNTSSASTGSITVTNNGFPLYTLTGGALSGNLTVPLPNAAGTYFIDASGITLNSHSLIITSGSATATFTTLGVASKTMIIATSRGSNTLACNGGTSTFT